MLPVQAHCARGGGEIATRFSAYRRREIDSDEELVDTVLTADDESDVAAEDGK